MSSSDNRRRFERLPCDVEVSLNSENNFYTGFIQNISAGGVFVATNQLLEVGTPVRFALSLKPGIERLQVQGVVRWVRELHEEVEDVPQGYGVEFEGLGAEARDRINRFITDLRESLFFED